jgi:hypothetical protein
MATGEEDEWEGRSIWVKPRRAAGFYPPPAALTGYPPRGVSAAQGRLVFRQKQKGSAAVVTIAEPFISSGKDVLDVLLSTSYVFWAYKVGICSLKIQSLPSILVLVCSMPFRG